MSKINTKVKKSNSGAKKLSSKTPLSTHSNPEPVSTPLYWIGEHDDVNYNVVSEMDYIFIGKQGLSKTSIDELANNLGISRKKMAEDVLNISVKTIERKNGSDKFDAQTSSHAIEIAKLFHHAYEVFEDKVTAQRWLGTPNASLNGKTPIELFSTMTGLRMVETILVRIEEGVYS